MPIKLSCINGLLFYALLSCHSVFAKTTNIIIFSNLTNQPIKQTQEPYLDNFSHYSNDSDYEFIAPSAVIQPAAKSTASVSYDWYHSWFNVNQFSYNYPGRTAEYGCFVTEIGLSWLFGGSYHIVISSYRKDPSYPNDYLICHTKQDSADTFTIDLVSSQDANEKNDSKLDDSKRYTIAGDGYELAHTSYFNINKPIPLNPSLLQPKLLLYPDQLYPSTVNDHYIPVSGSLNHMDEITVINHASVQVVAGPSPLLDKFSRFSNQYSFEMPSAILPNGTAKVKIGNPYNPGDFDLERFNYHIEGYAVDSGCFITTSKRWVTSPVTSFYFDSLHPEKNLYCLVTARDTIEIYDDSKLAQLTAHGCQESDLKNCISTYSRFYKDGETLDGKNFKYRKLPLAPDDSQHYLKVSPGAMDPAPYYMTYIPSA